MRSEFRHETKELQPALIKKFEGPGGGAKVLNVHGHGMQENGWPDLQVYSPHLPNHMIHMELKVKRSQPSGPQKERIRELRLRETHAWVVRAVGMDLAFENQNGGVEFTIENWQYATGIELMRLIHSVVDPQLFEGHEL